MTKEHIFKYYVLKAFCEISVLFLKYMFVCFSSWQNSEDPERPSHPAAQGTPSLPAGSWSNRVWSAELESAFWGPVYAEKCQVGKSILSVCGFSFFFFFFLIAFVLQLVGSWAILRSLCFWSCVDIWCLLSYRRVKACSNQEMMMTASTWSRMEDLSCAYKRMYVNDLLSSIWLSL